DEAFAAARRDRRARDSDQERISWRSAGRVADRAQRRQRFECPGGLYIDEKSLRRGRGRGRRWRLAGERMFVSPGVSAPGQLDRSRKAEPERKAKGETNAS